MTRSSAIHAERILLFLWLLTCLIVGAVMVHDYGMSIDEPNNQRYAADTWSAYPSFFGTFYEPEYRTSYDGHGPAFVTLAGIFVKVMQRVLPNAFAPDLWHFSYFAAFLLSGLCLYWLAKHWFSSWTAWGILILFSTQPLLWGHAFINPKDIPFMSFFIASIAAGFAMVDHLTAKVSPAEISVPSENHRKAFRKSFVSETVRDFTNPWLFLAGILLGLATSIRILGPYAGGIVLLYGLWKSPWRTLAMLPAYFMIAALICYLTWPFLWADPLGRLLESLNVASAYPWQGGVLFEGQTIAAKNLPPGYLPKMISIQFTEAAIVLFITGVMLAVRKILTKDAFVPLSLFFIWFVVPLAGIILSGSVVYDGFRQILFLLPPLFLMTGYAFEWIFARLANAALRLLVLALIATPGVYSIVTLHPYQYIYYNSIAGGVRGANENFELDYWATSYREAALFVNEIAPRDAHVAVFGPVEIVSPYTRPDIKLNSVNVARKLKESQNISFEYALILNRRNAIQEICADARTVKTVERAGALLMVVKEISPGQVDCP